MNRIRRSKNKPLLVEHSIVVIDPDRITREPAEGGGTHASPRMHWRRGNVHRAHDRTLQSGKVVRIPACVVPDDPAAGWGTHDYRVSKSNSTNEDFLK
jgi:hypothetical protein